MASHGRFVWYDLMTEDVEGAKRFYGEAIGWGIQMWEAGPEPYPMWVAGETPIGGVMTISEDAKKMGAPPNWMAYVAVDDVDKTCALARELGGNVFKQPTDIPEVGRFAVLADPQGAVFAAFKPLEPTADSVDQDKPGLFSWSELNTTDYEAAWEFYRRLFNWEHHSSMDMGPGGTYFMFHDAGDRSKGGMSNMAKQMNVPAHWLYYVTVENINDTVERIKAQGGQVLNGPMDIPGGDQIAQCVDPQGAHFAIYASGK